MLVDIIGVLWTCALEFSYFTDLCGASPHNPALGGEPLGEVSQDSSSPSVEDSEPGREVWVPSSSRMHQTLASCAPTVTFMHAISVRDVSGI